MYRRLLPMGFIALGVWLLTGCFKVPVIEHAAWPGQKDFRQYTGAPDSTRPIRVGAISRPQIVVLLGEPPLLERNGNAIGYVYESVKSVRVYPLCFFKTVPSAVGRYVARFDFDDKGILTRWQITDELPETVSYNLLFDYIPSYFFDDHPLGLTSRYMLEPDRHNLDQPRGRAPSLPNPEPASRPATNPSL